MQDVAHVTDQFEAVYANGSPDQMATLKIFFSSLGETKTTPLDLNASSSPDSGEDNSSFSATILD